VVSGSFQKMGASVRLTARVTEVATGRVAAAPKLDGTMDDLFSLQDKLSATLLSGIDRDAEPALSPAAPAQMKAYEWHARGRQELLRHGKSAFDQAIAHFEAAARADTTYAAPLSGLAAVYALRFTWTTDQSSLQIAAGYARRSIELDPESGEPHVWLGYVLIRQRRFAEAIEAERRAIALSPRYVMGPYFAGVAAALGGDVAGGIPYFQQALELEPAHCWSLLGLGWCHLDTGHDEEALWCLRRAAELEARRQAEAGPTCGVAGYLGEALRRTGRLAEARAACMEALEAVERSDHMYRDTFRAVTLCALGRTALQQGDRDGARAAFHQAAGQLKGRTRTLGGGFLLVQALAGLTRAGEGEAAHDEASRILASRQGHDFSELWACTDGPTLLELSRSAAACGRDEDAARLQTEARAAGAVEPP
jgi:tetratricopeptide (TPR) repeat protein